MLASVSAFAAEADEAPEAEAEETLTPVEDEEVQEPEAEPEAEPAPVPDQGNDGAGNTNPTMGKSLNQAVRDYLEQLAGSQQLANELQAFEQSVRATPGRLDGWRFDREEANRRA
jgi:hypothetical protein